MDVRRIKELLHAWRPGQDLPPELARARDLAAADPEVSAWLEQERAFDHAFADRLRGVQAPEGLLDSILAAHKAGEGNVVPFSPDAPRAAFGASAFMRYAVSIAASLLIVAGIFALASRNAPSSDDDLAGFIDATVLQALSGQMRDAGDIDGVREGLVAAGLKDMPGEIPEILADYKPARYGVIRTQQGNMGQIGFSGKESWRLIVMERRCLGGCSGRLTKPVIYDLGDKLAVTWAKGQQVFILVSDRSGENVIRDIAETGGTSF
ncbi:MAG: hypothetical protein WC360_05305 [Opitutales bacterium]|jgi:hypothetical protein